MSVIVFITQLIKSRPHTVIIHRILGAYHRSGRASFPHQFLLRPFFVPGQYFAFQTFLVLLLLPLTTLISLPFYLSVTSLKTYSIIITVIIIFVQKWAQKILLLNLLSTNFIAKAQWSLSYRVFFHRRHSKPFLLRAIIFSCPGRMFSYCVRARAYTHVLARVYSTRASTCTIYTCSTLPPTHVDLTGLQLSVF